MIRKQRKIAGRNASGVSRSLVGANTRSLIEEERR
jgi:hypothetical protein